jgi:hypothetical protein
MAFCKEELINMHEWKRKNGRWILYTDHFLHLALDTLYHVIIPICFKPPGYSVPGLFFGSSTHCKPDSNLFLSLGNDRRKMLFFSLWYC